MRALHRRREDVIACQGSSGGLSTAIKKRSSVSISRASGDWCALRIIQPSSGAAQIKHLLGARAVGRLKTQGHDPFSTPSNSCCGTILTLRSPFCRRMAGIS